MPDDDDDDDDDDDYGKKQYLEQITFLQCAVLWNEQVKKEQVKSQKDEIQLPGERGGVAIRYTGDAATASFVSSRLGRT